MPHRCTLGIFNEASEKQTQVAKCLKKMQLVLRCLSVFQAFTTGQMNERSFSPKRLALKATTVGNVPEFCPKSTIGDKSILETKQTAVPCRRFTLKSTVATYRVIPEVDNVFGLIIKLSHLCHH